MTKPVLSIKKKPLGRIIALLVSLLLIVACQNKSVTKESKATGTADTVVHISAPPQFKFSMYISGSGIHNKPFDSFTIDTNGIMGVHTTHRTAKGDWQTLNGLATLDPPDMDTLKMLVFTGKLYEIDSTDLTQKCGDDELYNINIVPLEGRKPVGLQVSACATDYNLLLQPQRRYFRMLVDWFERMRIKYRPVQPE